MKKEDLTTRLLRNFFHIQGPFDECRQEVIYKACARSMIQIFYSSFILFLFYILFGSFIEIVRKCYALHLFLDSFLFMSIKSSKKPSKSFILKRMTNQKSFSKPTAKPKSNSEAGLCFIGIQIGFFTLLIFHKVFVQQMSFSDFGKLLMQFDKSGPFLMYGLIIGSIFLLL